MSYFILDSDKLTESALKGLQESIRLAKQAHTTDLELRVNAQDVRKQADWVKYLEEVQVSEIDE
jgi:hypothetical protein